MFFLQEQVFSEEEARVFVEAVHDPENAPLRTMIIDPIISILEKPQGRKEYIRYGNEFLEANSEMLSKEFPTKPVSFPRLYVDGIFKMFGFEQKSFKENLKQILKTVSDRTSFQTIIASPTNVIHSIVLMYSDMIQNRELRDSARQQMGLSIYNNVFNHFFHPPHPIESTMAYVYMNLDNSWNLVKSENVINWIGGTVDTSFAYWRGKMSLDMSASILVQFLNRVRSSFQQNLRLLANQYYENMDKGNLIGDDVNSNDMYLETNNTIKIREGLIRRINGGDQLYKDKGNLYTGIARIKNVKVDTLYQFAQEIDTKDIGVIIDTIFYVFITKEGNTLDDINSTKYISRITNLPTAIDRAIAGKPIIMTLSKKYKADSSIVKAYICLVATYIMYRINDVRS
jgi:hypothetical protein